MQTVLVGKPEEKRPFRRPGHLWENNIKMDLKEIQLEGVDWIHLAQDRDWWLADMNLVIKLHKRR
jgi:hypothetical protein